jgi:hypothetical protein
MRLLASSLLVGLVTALAPACSLPGNILAQSCSTDSDCAGYEPIGSLLYDFECNTPSCDAGSCNARAYNHALPDDHHGDCVIPVCRGGSKQYVPDYADAPPSEDPCRPNVCTDAGMAQRSLAPDGTWCDTDAACAGGVCVGSDGG